MILNHPQEIVAVSLLFAAAFVAEWLLAEYLK